jgi:hypothetical protein
MPRRRLPAPSCCYLGQVDVLTSGHALSVIHPNTPGPGRVQGTCGDASGAVRPVHAQRWPRQADPRRFSQRLEDSFNKKCDSSAAKIEEIGPCQCHGF